MLAKSVFFPGPRYWLMDAGVIPSECVVDVVKLAELRAPGIVEAVSGGELALLQLGRDGGVHGFYRLATRAFQRGC